MTGFVVLVIHSKLKLAGLLKNIPDFFKFSAEFLLRLLELGTGGAKLQGL